ncbi:hypothetical protein DL766_004564 [Monosporascus sp. MC13-8B]|uniref:J domain-containing protein n=1 Tax=Monosporascus cannonballus TaxID=155416 RepID=A0ABY0H0V2_9PEZI|nr:hypothetical protein DL762_008380 [Monosporascus cannonballus]RYO83225.1 hypothetical protein DL763_007958 [Monosporascus cannonballus]RYP31044.1 hypothetical protein DL766_004564 [Monosporascus sp. MC13-8B]
MDNKSDLLQYARDFANQDEDLYALLGVDATTPKEDIHRAWRKRSLKYHPDKAGKDFDATKWQLFERARDVLSDADARGAYDSARSAALLREAQRQAMDAKRRQMIEDLEARERGVKRPRDDDEARRKNAISEEEKQRLVAAGRRRMEERQRQMREAEERERQRELGKQEGGAQQQPQQGHRPKYDAVDGEEDNTPDLPAAEALGGDEYDEKIADLERRLQESRARKAAKKARKSGVVPEPPTPRAAGTMEEAQETPIHDPGVTELKADDKKGIPPPSKAFSFSAPRSTSSEAAATGPPRVKGDFSSTMARLRAAQAEKEARKKAKQEAAAAGSASQ